MNKSKKHGKPRWQRSRRKNVNHQSIHRPRSESKVKRINMVKKLERKGYFDDESFE